MRASPLRLSAVTRMERHAATQLVRRAISDAGGWITDFRQFSNFAVVLDLEITSVRLAELYAAIEATGIALSPPRSELPCRRRKRRRSKGPCGSSSSTMSPNCGSRSRPYLAEFPGSDAGRHTNATQEVHSTPLLRRSQPADCQIWVIKHPMRYLGSGGSGATGSQG